MSGQVDGVTERFGIRFGPKARTEVVETVSIRRPLLVCARQSKQRTRSACRAVARDLLEGVEALERQLDIDVRHHLPSQAVLESMLMTSTDVVPSISFSDGKPFTNTFTVLDLRTRGIGVVFLLCAGTSAQLDANRKQPFIVRVADLIGELIPILVFAKTSARQFRHDWGQSDMRIELAEKREQGYTIFEATEAGYKEVGTFADAERLLEGAANKREARSITTNGFRSMYTYTGGDPVMEGGSVVYHVGGAMPPGLVRFTMTTKAASGREKRLFLDCPEAWPKAQDIVTRLPNVRDGDGNLVCQVENVRWLISNVGKEDWPLLAIGEELERRLFATQQLRSRGGPDATFATWYESGTMAFTSSHSFFRNLDMYETGRKVFVRKGVGVITVTNLFPLDGPWGDKEDFARIRDWLSRSAARNERRVFYSLTRLPVTVNGRPATLRFHPQGDGPSTSEGRYGYRWTTDEPRGHAARRERATEDAGAGEAITPHLSDKSSGWERNLPMLPHLPFAESIVEAVAESGKTPLLPVTVEDAAPEIESASRAVRRVTTLLEASNAEMARLNAQASEVTPEGEYVVPQLVRLDLWAQHEAEREKTADLLAKQDAARVVYEEAVVRHARLARGLEVSTLLDALVSLQDPTDVTYHRMWMSSIKDVVIRDERTRRQGLRANRLSWTFRLRVSDGDVAGDIAGGGEVVTGSLVRRDALAAGRAELLRQGVPIRREVDRAHYPIVLEHLGLRGYAPQLMSEVPHLLRLHMRIIDALHDGVSHAAVVDRLGRDRKLREAFARPRSLVRRILAQFHDPVPVNQGWLMRVGTHEPAALETAARRDGWIRGSELGGTYIKVLRTSLARNGRISDWTDEGEDLRLRPCPHCGSRQRALARLAEVQGYLCLSCRHDTEGVTWATFVDPYLLPRPEGPIECPAGWVPDTGRRWRRRSEMSPAELTAATRRYVEDGLTVLDVAAELDCTPVTVREYLRGQGVLRRAGRRKKPRTPK